MLRYLRHMKHNYGRHEQNTQLRLSLNDGQTLTNRGLYTSETKRKGKDFQIRKLHKDFDQHCAMAVPLPASLSPKATKQPGRLLNS
jgi:hypothetical protein